MSMTCHIVLNNTPLTLSFFLSMLSDISLIPITSTLVDFNTTVSDAQIVETEKFRQMKVFLITLTILIRLS
jgi:hypothetical protein